MQTEIVLEPGPEEPPDLCGPDGDAAVLALYDAHSRSLHRYLARRVGQDLADDLVAEAFLVMWERRADYDPSRAGARAWLFGIATNLARMHERTEVRKLRAWARELGRGLDVEAPDSRAAAAVDAAHDVGRYAEALAGLRPEERDVLLLTAWADLSPTEIARVLDLRVTTVRTRLHRARGRLLRRGGKP
ncbi:RNA polymerase sigma factor [Allokutzneria albata]|uniref:RNA polymerase sigma-70 factor, ECF subfamily n=1 Tax=Allokutzneria albata TaxID=211114 RepID=A0A1H0AN37_ALLAB|nr:RNA polymerase sigma factor [Allokutzneria albata]SDN34897.1 RNA polymerase sigma-70 factor, ECF subfamily [Allokutzneria albata]